MEKYFTKKNVYGKHPLTVYISFRKFWREKIKIKLSICWKPGNMGSF
jgi:hypothetical protein